MSERQYAADAGLSRGAIQKAKATNRLALFPDGSIDAPASDAKRAATTDPSTQRNANPRRKLKPVPDAALSAVGDTLRENGLTTSTTAGGTNFLQAKTANEVLKAQERRLRLQKMKGELVSTARERPRWSSAWRARSAMLGSTGLCPSAPASPDLAA